MKLLVTGAFNCTNDKIELIEQMGHTVIYMQNESDGLPCDPSVVEGVICNGLFLHHSIEDFTSLKYIQLTSAGLDRVPLEYIKEHKIVVNNAKDVYSIPMAEFAMCGVLQMLKNSKEFMHNQENCLWVKQRNISELFGKTVCIIGCGSVGTEVAKRFFAFGCKVIGVDLFVQKKEYYQEIYSIETIEDALREADVVVLTLPINEQTKYLINKHTIGMMKKEAILVNLARGMIVNTEDLIDALNNHIIFGAVLDVFEEEPLSQDSCLWHMENVIVTPHNSFVGDGNSLRLWNIIKNNLESYI